MILKITIYYLFLLNILIDPWHRDKFYIPSWHRDEFYIPPWYRDKFPDCLFFLRCHFPEIKLIREPILHDIKTESTKHSERKNTLAKLASTYIQKKYMKEIFLQTYSCERKSFFKFDKKKTFF